MVEVKTYLFFVLVLIGCVTVLVISDVAHASSDFDFSYQKTTWNLYLYGEIISYDSEGIADFSTKIFLEQPSRDMSQYIDEIVLLSTPQVPSSIESDGLVFWWDDIEEAKYSYSANISINRNQYYYPYEILSNINLGRESLSITQRQDYLKYDTIVDTSDQLETLAKRLQRDTDLGSAFAAVDWIHKTKRITGLGNLQKATQAFFENRISVEGSVALFMSIMKSLDIPVRFAYGLAYDDAMVMMPHIWAEIYSQDYGWIPVDVLYNQVGFLDYSHLTFFLNPEFRIGLAAHSGEGDSVDLETEEINYEYDVIGQEGDMQELIQITAQVMYDVIVPGSYNLVEIVIRNTVDVPVVIDLEFPDGDGRVVVERIDDTFIYLDAQETYSMHAVIKDMTSELDLGDSDKVSYKLEERDHRNVFARGKISYEYSVSSDGLNLQLADMLDYMERNIHLLSERTQPSDEELKELIVRNELDVDVDKFIKQYRETQESANIRKYTAYDEETNTTSVFIEIDPTEDLTNVSIYEEIPKCLIELITDDVMESMSSAIGFEIINPDPLIVWNLEEVTEPITLNYDVLDSIRDIDCEDESSTVALAQRLEEFSSGQEMGHSLDMDMTQIMPLITFFCVVSFFGIYIFFRRFDPEDDNDEQNQQNQQLYTPKGDNPQPQRSYDMNQGSGVYGQQYNYGYNHYQGTYQNYQGSSNGQYNQKNFRRNSYDDQRR